MAAHAGAENNNSCLRLLSIHQQIQIERTLKGVGYNSCYIHYFYHHLRKILGDIFKSKHNDLDMGF